MAKKLKKCNKKGIGYCADAQRKLREIFKKLGWPRLPIHSLGLNETLLQEETKAAPPRREVVSAGKFEHGEKRGV